MLGLHELLYSRGLRPAKKTVKLVRHKDARYPLAERVGTPWFDEYQAIQSKPLFHGCSHIVSFLGEDGTRSRLIGVYAVGRERKALDVASPAMIEEHKIKAHHIHYELDLVNAFDDLAGRVVIDWGKSALAWHQWYSDREVLEVRGAGRALAPFEDYLKVHLTHRQLRDLAAAPEAHRDWIAALKAVGGVYLIVSRVTGAQYIGSATGADGLWGRWLSYAQSGHGGNLALRELCQTPASYPAAFRFSILATFSKTLGKQQALDQESFYKEKLGTKAFGLNMN
ncbi:MAG: GIY-YIG nuclease family protein [Gemmatimonadales bacterium]